MVDAGSPEVFKTRLRELKLVSPEKLGSTAARDSV